MGYKSIICWSNLSSAIMVIRPNLYNLKPPSAKFKLVQMSQVHPPSRARRPHWPITSTTGWNMNFPSWDTRPSVQYWHMCDAMHCTKATPNSLDPLHNKWTTHSQTPTYGFVFTSRKWVNLGMVTCTIETLYVGLTHLNKEDRTKPSQFHSNIHMGHHVPSST